MSEHSSTPTPANNSESLTFQDSELTVIDKDGEQWLTAADISRALGYSNSNAVTRLFNRNKDEFDDSMSLKVNMTLRGMPQEFRVFNKRGCQMIALLARTNKSKQFRKWVLDVLESNEPNSQNDYSDHQTPRLENRHTSYVLLKMHGSEVVETYPLSVDRLQKVTEELYPEHLLINRCAVLKDIDKAMHTMHGAMASAAHKLLPLQLLLESSDLEKAQRGRTARLMSSFGGAA